MNPLNLTTLNRYNAARSLACAVLAAALTPHLFAQRSVVTDEPPQVVGKPAGAADYVAKAAPTDGQYLALTLKKLEEGFDPPRPFLIWALGSSYTNMLGVGEPWKEMIPKLFPKAPEIRYEKMVGNSCPWQYLRGWARHLAVPDQPDLVITYTNGNAADLEKLIIEIKSNQTPPPTSSFRACTGVSATNRCGASRRTPRIRMWPPCARSAASTASSSSRAAVTGPNT